MGRPGFRQLTGFGFSRYLTQYYEYNLGSLHYDLTVTVDEVYGHATVVTENTNMDSTQIAAMRSFLAGESLGSATTTASGSGTSGGQPYDWEITLSDERTISDDVTIFNGILPTAATWQALVETQDADAWLSVGWEYVNGTLGNFVNPASVSTTAPDADFKVLNYLSSFGYFSATGDWWQDRPYAGDVPDYSCTFSEDPAGVSVEVPPRLEIGFAFARLGAGNICADSKRYLQTSGVPTVGTDKCFATTNGWVIFGLPEDGGYYYPISNVNTTFTAPGFLTAGDCPCTNAP